MRSSHGLFSWYKSLVLRTVLSSHLPFFASESSDPGLQSSSLIKGHKFRKLSHPNTDMKIQMFNRELVKLICTFPFNVKLWAGMSKLPGDD